MSAPYFRWWFRPDRNKFPDVEPGPHQYRSEQPDPGCICNRIGGDNGSYVNGNVELSFDQGNPGPKLAPVGWNGYAPVTLDPSFTGTGAVVVKTTVNDHPDVLNSGVDAAKSVNRY